MTDRYHIIPLNDLKPHIESGTYCPCAPYIKREPPNELVIHNAFDGREFYEQIKDDKSLAQKGDR